MRLEQALLLFRDSRQERRFLCVDAADPVRCVVTKRFERGEFLGRDIVLLQHRPPRTVRLVQDFLTHGFKVVQFVVELPQTHLLDIGLILAPCPDPFECKSESLHPACLASSPSLVTVSPNVAFTAESCFRKSRTCARERMAASSLGFDPLAYAPRLMRSSARWYVASDSRIFRAAAF